MHPKFGTFDPGTLAELVAANPSAARVLDAFGLDYCCHGEQTLTDACERREALEADTHQHILKENHTLFPAALALADS